MENQPFVEFAAKERRARIKSPTFKTWFNTIQDLPRRNILQAVVFDTLYDLAYSGFEGHVRALSLDAAQAVGVDTLH